MNAEQVIELLKPETNEIKEITADDKLDCKAIITGMLSVTGYNIVVQFLSESGSIYFKLTQFAANCGILVAHEIFVALNKRRKGISQVLFKAIDKIAYTDGYTLLVGSSTQHNLYIDKAAHKAGWAAWGHQFSNKRTGNTITMWGKVVPAQVQFVVPPLVIPEPASLWAA